MAELQTREVALAGALILLVSLPATIAARGLVRAATTAEAATPTKAVAHS